MDSSRSRSRRLSPPSRTRSHARAVVASALLIALGLFAAAVIWLWASPAVAAPISEVPVQLSGPVKVQVDDLHAQADAVQAEIDGLDAELETQTESYNQMQVKLDQLNVRMADLRRQLEQAETEHAARVHKLEERLRAMYKAGGRDQLLQMLLLSDGLSDLINRIKVVSTVADQDRRLVDELKSSTDRLNTVLAEIDTHKREELSIRAQMDDQRGEIQQKLTERQNSLAGIDSRITAIIDQERQRQAEEQEQLRQSLQQLLDGTGLYSGPLPPTGSPLLDQFVQTAASYMGIPYVWGGDRPSTGFDCSGFTRYVYAQHGVNLPHYSGYQAQMGTPVEPSDIQPGDLVAFGVPVHHVGIYIGGGYFIEAPRTGDVIKLTPILSKRNLSAIRRFPIQPRIGPPTVG